MKYAQAYKDLAAFGHQLLNHPSLDEGLPLIAKYAKELVGAERASIFLYSPKRKVLWTTLSDGIEEVVIDPDQGIAGSCFRSGEPIVVNDAYNDPRFYPEIDEKSGYHTESVLAIPVFGADKRVIGVFQMLNSQHGGFTEEDVEFLKFFSHFVSGYLELASIIKEKEEKA